MTDAPIKDDRPYSLADLTELQRLRAEVWDLRRNHAEQLQARRVDVLRAAATVVENCTSLTQAAAALRAAAIAGRNAKGPTA